MAATAERVALAAQVAELRAQGLTQREVAERLGITRSWVGTLCQDPLGLEQRRRRDSYDGVCERCGGPTKSTGTSVPSATCADCSHIIQKENAKWTRETVIDAIQRFAAIHGRPPTSKEWITSDRANNYPVSSVVYGQYPGRVWKAPFAKWADAIEAAGFNRPRTGMRRAREHTSVCESCQCEFTYDYWGAERSWCGECEPTTPRTKQARRDRRYREKITA